MKDDRYDEMRMCLTGPGFLIRSCRCLGLKRCDSQIVSPSADDFVIILSVTCFKDCCSLYSGSGNLDSCPGSDTKRSPIRMTAMTAMSFL